MLSHVLKNQSSQTKGDYRMDHVVRFLPGGLAQIIAYWEHRQHDGVEDIVIKPCYDVRTREGKQYGKTYDC